MQALASRYLGLGLLSVGLIAYYFRFSLHPEGMTLYPQAAACMLNGEPMDRCSPLFTYPPLFAFLMIPFTILPLWARNIVWYLILVSLTYGSFRLCEQLVLGALEKPLDRRTLIAFRALSLLFIANFVLAVFENQSFDILVFFLVVVGLTGLARQRPAWSSVGFGLAASLKVTPLLFFPYLLIRKRWRDFILCLCVYIAFSLLPDLFFTIGSGDGTYYGNWVRQVALQPFTHSIPQGGMLSFWEGENPLNQSLRPLILRIAANVGLGAHFLLILYTTYTFCLMYGLWVFIRSSESRHMYVLDGALVLMGMLLLSPMSSKSHFVALMLPFMFLSARMLALYPHSTVLIVASISSCLLNNLTSKDLVGRPLATMAGSWGSVTIGTIILAMTMGYIAWSEGTCWKIAKQSTHLITSIAFRTRRSA